jgi:hypothetical protein
MRQRLTAARLVVILRSGEKLQFRVTLSLAMPFAAHRHSEKPWLFKDPAFLKWVLV